MGAQPAILVSQDLSGIGQVALGAAIPVLVAMGYNPSILPTAVLSTHTGGLGNPVVADLAGKIAGTLTHWESLGIQWRGLQLGYLGSAAATVWQDWLPRLAPQIPVRLIDPVLGDAGRLYRGFDTADIAVMRTLVTHATVITPNPTEAAFLLNRPVPEQLTEAAAQELVLALVNRFKVATVMTGVPLSNGTTAVIGGTLGEETPWIQRTPTLPGHFFGTGDLFASVLVGALCTGRPLANSTAIAMTAVTQAIEATVAAHRDPKLGVAISAALPFLTTKGVE